MAYASITIISNHTAPKEEENNIVFFRIASERTKGLNFAILIIAIGMLSKGSIMLDNSSIKLATDILAIVAVSWELKL